MRQWLGVGGGDGVEVLQLRRGPRAARRQRRWRGRTCTRTTKARCQGCARGGGLHGSAKMATNRARVGCLPALQSRGGRRCGCLAVLVESTRAGVLWWVEQWWWWLGAGELVRRAGAYSRGACACIGRRSGRRRRVVQRLGGARAAINHAPGAVPSLCGCRHRHRRARHEENGEQNGPPLRVALLPRARLLTSIPSSPRILNQNQAHGIVAGSKLINLGTRIIQKD